MDFVGQMNYEGRSGSQFWNDRMRKSMFIYQNNFIEFKPQQMFQSQSDDLQEEDEIVLS